MCLTFHNILPLDSISLIALPPLSDATNTYVGILAKVSGFGKTSDSKQQSTIFNLALNLMFFRGHSQ
jgi:hypothetical protein